MIRVVVNPESVLGILSARQENAMDGTPVYHRTLCTHSPRGQIRVANPHTGMFWEMEGNQRTYKLKVVTIQLKNSANNQYNSLMELIK